MISYAEYVMQQKRKFDNISYKIKCVVDDRIPLSINFIILSENNFLMNTNEKEILNK